MINNLELSEYVTIIITVPETHADKIRDTIAKSGAGKIGGYSYCSFSIKGVSHFMPNQNTQPTIGKINQLETVIEERIETICETKYLEKVIHEIKKAHPYEITVIDIIPIYKIGIKQ